MHLSGQPIKWTSEVKGDVQAVRVEIFCLMKLAESGVNTGIP
jgi:hypothetical protein